VAARKHSGARALGTRNSRAPSGVDLNSVGVSTSRKPCFVEKHARRRGDFAANAQVAHHLGTAQIEVRYFRRIPRSLAGGFGIVTGNGSTSAMVQDFERRNADSISPVGIWNCSCLRER